MIRGDSDSDPMIESSGFGNARSGPASDLGLLVTCHFACHSLPAGTSRPLSIPDAQARYATGQPEVQISDSDSDARPV